MASDTGELVSGVGPRSGKTAFLRHGAEGEVLGPESLREEVTRRSAGAPRLSSGADAGLIRVVADRQTMPEAFTFSREGIT